MNRRSHRLYVVYRFDDGGSICRRITIPPVYNNTEYRRYAHFVIFGDLWDVSEPPDAPEIVQLDTVFFILKDPGMDELIGDTNGNKPLAVTSRYLAPFCADLSIGDGWFMGSLKKVIEIDERFMGALNRAQDFETPEEAVHDLGRASVKLLHEGLQGLNHVTAELAEPSGERPVRNEVRIWFDSPILNRNKMHFKIGRIATYDEKKSLSRCLWQVGSYFQNEEYPNTLHNHESLPLAWESLVDKMERGDNLRMVPSSQLETFWATHEKRGRAAFDTSTFDLLGVASPVLLPDDDFIAWAEAVGLERRAP